ncbi:MAG: hypothetical protein IPP69_01785 [Flavobacteriales bacterium]|nr:hypothetical protein [Flavobacteriales bacterium]
MNATVYLSYVMVALLVLLAIVCFVVPATTEWLPGNRRYIMGIILLTYAAIRAYRLRVFIKKNSHE